MESRPLVGHELMHPREEQLNDYVDAALDPEDHQTVARHLEQCADCARFVAQLQHIVLDAASLPPLDPPPAVWGAIESALRHEPRGGAIAWLPGGPAWGLATAAAVVMAFLAGRVIEQREQQAQRQQRSQAEVARVNGGGAGNVSTDSAANVRARVLLVAVGD